MIDWVTTSNNNWYNELQRVATNDNERYSEWQQAVISANFPFFFPENKRTTTKHPKENSLNYEEDLEAALLNLEQKQAPKKK